RITKYITQFSPIATQVRWGHDALRYQFYRRLPDRLKDRISEIGKPDNLSDLHILTQSLDHRYWERKAERNRETPSSSKSGSKSGSGSNHSEPRSSSNSQSTPCAPQKSSDGKSSSSGSTSKSNSKPKSTEKSAPKPYTDKLGKDEKLTLEE
ncbi:hypothetical protein BD310DRAFT_830933, partial [Dichomitus squalens]